VVAVCDGCFIDSGGDPAIGRVPHAIVISANSVVCSAASAGLSMFHDWICSPPRGVATLAMMANRKEQMTLQSWAAGYEEGYAAGLAEAWERVSALIKGGPLPRDRFERRNGLLLACRVIARPKSLKFVRRI
jgi:hypothetical protein